MNNIKTSNISDESIRSAYLKYSSYSNGEFNKVGPVISAITDSEARDVITTTIASYQGVRWLEDVENLKAIKSVISTVKTLRTNDSNLTDRDIYIYYRQRNRLVSDEATKKEFSEASIILQALMGGKISGELLF